MSANKPGGSFEGGATPFVAGIPGNEEEEEEADKEEDNDREEEEEEEETEEEEEEEEASDARKDGGSDENIFGASDIICLRTSRGCIRLEIVSTLARMSVGPKTMARLEGLILFTSSSREISYRNGNK